MTDYMLTGFTVGLGHRDVQVNNAGSIAEAIEVAEKVTGCRISHGRGGIGSQFDPAIVIDAERGAVETIHDRSATTSTQIAMPRDAQSVRAVLTPVGHKPTEQEPS